MKHLRFFTLLFLILATRAYDFYSTYRFTPDLSKEGNPLVLLTGSNWYYLTAILLVLLLFVLYGLYVSIYKPINIIPKETGLSFGSFIAYTYFGKPEKFISVFYKIPKDTKRAGYITGGLLPLSLLWAGIVTTIMWLLINHTDNYYTNYHSYKLTILVIILGIVGIAYNYFRNLYKIYNSKDSYKSVAFS